MLALYLLSVLIAHQSESRRHHLDSRQTTSQTYSSQSLPLHPGPHCGTPVAETMSCHGRNGQGWIMVDRAFPTAAPRAWNQLPTELKRTKSTSAFRRGLKTFLFNRTYCSE